MTTKIEFLHTNGEGDWDQEMQKAEKMANGFMIGKDVKSCQFQINPSTYEDDDGDEEDNSSIMVMIVYEV